MHLPEPLLAAMPAVEIAAHCVWEMTFYGFTQERIASKRLELHRACRELYEGKPELAELDEAMARLRAKFGWQEDEPTPREDSDEIPHS